jgi:hypothetical protein
MSRSMLSGARRSLALATGILSATLVASTFGSCPSGESPVPGEPIVGIPMRFGVPWYGVQSPHRGSNGTVEFEWGDGTASEAGIFCTIDPHTPVGGSCVAGGSHTYSTVENRIHITVGGSLCTSAPFNVGAAGSPPPPPPGGDVLSNPKLALRRVPVNVEVTGVIATFHDSNPSAVVSDFTAVIDWGDGTQSGGVVSSPSPGTLDVSAPAGGHTYATSGMVTVSVSLSAPGVTASTATGAVSVGRHR